MLTIPVLITSARPAMVYKNNKKLVFIELTIPSNSIKNQEDTQQSYQLLVSDLEIASFNALIINQCYTKISDFINVILFALL